MTRSNHDHASIKLSWHEGNRCWCKYIGRVKTKDGKHLVPKPFYFGKDKAEAERRATQLKRAWATLKKSWQHAYRPILEALDDPFADTPHWPQNQQMLGARVSEDQIEEYHEQTFPCEDDLAETFADVTLKEVMTRFLLAQKARTKEAEGIKLQTYRNIERQLTAAARGTDLRLRLADLRQHHLQCFRTYWMKLPNGIRKRTAVNYCKIFASMLRWAYANDVGAGSEKPRGFDQIFSFQAYKSPDVRPVPPDELKRLLKVSNLRTRLYIMLALTECDPASGEPSANFDNFQVYQYPRPLL